MEQCDNTVEQCDITVKHCESTLEYCDTAIENARTKGALPFLLLFLLSQFSILAQKMLAGHGGTHLESKHLGGRGRQISKFEASLVYRVSSRPTQRNPVFRNKTKQNKTKQNKTKQNKTKRNETK
jgi:hypothetical protein